MTQFSIIEELVKVVPVLIGGALTLAGGIVGQLMTHKLSNIREAKSLRIQKGEALIKALYNHEAWTEEKRLHTIIKNLEHDSDAPINEARMIQQLYFPEITEEFARISNAYIALLKYLLEFPLKRLEHPDTWYHSWDLGKHGALYAEQHYAIIAVATKCQKLLFLLPETNRSLKLGDFKISFRRKTKSDDKQIRT